jgi:uncharacterized protein
MNLIRFLILMVAFLALNVYLFTRGWQAIPDKKWLHGLYTGLFLISSLSIFVAIFAAAKLPLWVSFVFEQVGGYWMILFVFMVAGALLGDLLRVTNHLFHVFPAGVTLHYAQAKLLYFFAVLGALLLISLIGFYRFSHPHVTELTIHAGSDTSQVKELTLVMASDLHLGNVIRKSRLAKWVDLINSQKPDIIILDGDIFDHSYRSVAEQHMDEELRRLHAAHGVVAVPGNHDYYTGVDRVLAYLRQAGITVLRDSCMTVDSSLLIIGRDDRSNRNRKPLASLIAGQDAHLPRLVLDHQPHEMEESLKNRTDLHLSGHTHDGQIFPFNRIVEKIYELGYGFRKTGNTNYYVSSGIGLWAAPIRLGTRSEIVMIHLKAGRY